MGQDGINLDRGPWRSIFMFILNLSFCVEKQFPFPLSTAELLGEYCYNRKQEVNMFMSVITYKLAHRLLFVKRLCEANLLKKNPRVQNCFIIHAANSVRIAIDAIKKWSILNNTRKRLTHRTIGTLSLTVEVIAY